MSSKIVNWTYGRDPTGSTRDAVRLLIGDTNPEDKQLDDDEIAWLLSDNGGPLNASIAAAVGLAAMYARFYDSTEVGPDGKPKRSSSNKESLSKHYLDLAERLMMQRRRKGAIAQVSGQTVADKLAAESRTDLVRPFFRRDMMDYGATYQDLRVYWSY